MIKKNTKVVFQEGGSEKSKDMIGGIPLSKGETIKVHEGDKVIMYVVTDKIVECFFDGDNKTVNITYIVKAIEAKNNHG
ncbi:MAG: hypothetical protein WC845_03805 [Candidatus Staskawiczbacteria bacterium]|jgi:hypothetical protein